MLQMSRGNYLGAHNTRKAAVINSWIEQLRRGFFVKHKLFLKKDEKHA